MSALGQTRTSQGECFAEAARFGVRAKKRKKAALAALVFEDWNGTTSSQKTIPEAIKACGCCKNTPTKV
jgi:hypothetical protein